MSIPSALRQLQTFLNSDPDNVELRVEALRLALEAGDVATANQLIAQAPPEAAADPVLRHAAAHVNLAAHRWADAIGQLNALVNEGVDAPAVHFDLGYALLRHGDAATAADVLRQVVALAEAPAESLSYLLRALHHLSDLDGAIACWHDASQRLRTAQAHGVFSLILFDANRLEEVRPIVAEAMKSRPPALEALVSGAMIATMDGQQDVARALLDQAEAISPNDGRVNSAVGIAYLAQGQLEPAHAALERAVAAMPGHVGSWHALAWCQLTRRELDAAQQSLETALSLDRNFAETHGGLAVIAALRGHRDAAASHIERARRLDRRSLAVEYAEALLNGKAQDASAVRTLAMRLLKGRAGGLSGSGLVRQAFDDDAKTLH